MRRASVGLLRLGAARRALRGCARRGARGYTTPASGWLLCTGSGSRALLRRACALVMRSAGLVAAGAEAHGVLGSLCGAVRLGCHPWLLNCPTLAGALCVRPRGSYKVRRVPVCACDSARLFLARRGCARRGTGHAYTPASGWFVCARAPAARALLRWLSGRLRRLAGWARLVRGSWRHGKPLRGAGAAWV